MLKSLTAALLCLPIVALAGESWTVETAPGSGSWIDNPNCTGQCAKDRESARQPDRPTPQPPKQIPGEKPRPTLKADKSDHEPAPMETAPGYYCRLKGEVVNYMNAPGPQPKDLRTVTRACPSYAHKVNKNGGVPGLFGPHEGGK